MTAGIADPMPQTGAFTRENRAHWLALAALIVATTLAYWSSFRGALVFDDVPGIANNPTIRDLRRLDLLWVAIGPQGGTLSGRPVPNLTLGVNYAISGLNLWSYHAANLLIHALAGCTLFGLVRRTLLRPALAGRFGRDALPLALAIAALWCLHPLQTESVTYLVQRVESLMGLFYLLTLYCFVRALDAPKPARWQVAGFFACLVGMGCKEVMVSAPLAILVYDRLFGAGSWREVWRRHGRFHVALLATWVPLGALIVASAGRGGTAGFGIETSWWNYALTQSKVILAYVRLSVWPHPLIFDHNVPLVRGLGEVWPHTLLVLAGVGVTAYWLIRGAAAGFLGACFFLILAPTSSFVPIDDAMFEHRMYLPLAAVIGGLVLALHQRVGRPAFLVWGGVAVIFGGLTFARNFVYHSPLELWADVARKLPENPRAHNSMGAYLFTAGRLEEAEQRFATALRLNPKFASAHYNFARLQEKTGRTAEALASYQTAVRLSPRLDDAHVNLGNLLDRLGRPAEAIAHYEAALAVEPDAAEVHAYLGAALLKLKRGPAAIAHLQTALRLEPERVDAWCDLARAHQQQNDMPAARRAVDEALRLAPRHPVSLYVRGNIQASLGEFADAIASYREAVAAAPDYVAARNNLANALLVTGRIDEAISLYRQILEQQPTDASVRENLERALQMRR